LVAIPETLALITKCLAVNFVEAHLKKIKPVHEFYMISPMELRVEKEGANLLQKRFMSNQV
jgi:hypothetical protein